MIKPTTKQIASNENTNAPQLQFSSYEQNKTYRNDGTIIDFVTDGKSLYVCAVEMAVTSENTIEQEIELHGNFLKVISQGEQGAQGRPGDDGAPGATPNLTFRFDGKQLVISENGQRKAVSPDLAGPSGRPVLNGRSINGTLSKDTTTPQPLNIDDITVPERPLLLRTDSDNTRRLDEESGPARFIQWKYEGEEEWRNLISISELMNLALAGVSFGREEDGGHFGHKEVISATYESDASGNQIISNVELGNVLFDAGTIPASLDGDALAAAIQELKDRLDNLNVDDLGDLTNVFATKDGVRDGFQPKGNYQPAGNYLTEHQSLANYATKSEIPTGVVKGVQVNDEQTQTPDSNGIVHLTVTGGDGTLNPEDLSEYAQKTGVNSRFVSNETLSSTLNNYASKTWVNDQGFLKNVDLNGFVRTVNNISPVNGNITIDIADNPIMNLYIGQDNHLFKRSYRDNQDIDLGPISGDGPGSGLTEAQVKSIVGRILEGLELPSEYTHTDGHTYFIRTSDLTDYTTVAKVKALIQDALIDAGDVDYYRVFTLYQRTSNSTDVPLRPTVGIGTGNTANGDVLVCSNPNTPWKNHPENASTGSEYLGMTSATYSYRSKAEVGSSTSSVNNGVYTYADDYAWSNPICLTGGEGKDGEDGAGVEFIYHLGPKDTTPTINILRASKEGETAKSFVNNTTAREGGASYGVNGSNDGQPGDDNNGYGTDDPTGIDDETNKRVEYASVRTSRYDPNLGTSVGSDFSSPFIWSMGGEDGMDGAGVEYIFCVTATQEEKPVISALIPRIGQTYNDFDSLFPNYQEDDWYPKDGMGNANRWTDNPLDVDENQPYEGVAIRKKTTNPATGESSGGYFSDPKVGGLGGSRTTIINQPSNSYFTPYTCYAFTRTNIENFDRNYIVQTTWEAAGQTYANGIAQDQSRDHDFRANPLNYLVTKRREGNNGVIDGNIQGYDTVPDGTEQLYLISNHIGDELDGVETGGDGPIKGGDQAGLQIEYAVSDQYSDAVYNRQKTLYNLSRKENGVAVYETDDPTLDHDGDGIDESLGRDHVRSANMGTGGDIDETPGSTYYVSDPDYMACCMKQANGLGTDGQVIKVKGEQGPQGNPGTPGAPGADGTDIEFIYYRTKEGFTPGISTTEYKFKNSNNGIVGGYTDVDDALPKVSNYSGSYSDGGQYGHDNPTGVSEEYPYEGTSTRRSYYTNGTKHGEAFYTPATIGTKGGANGQDGDGVEYIFYLVDANAVTYNTSTGKGTLKSHASNQNVYGPDNSGTYDDPQNGGSDEPKGVTEDYPYEFVSIRRYDGDNQEGLAGSTPALGTRGAKDGQNGRAGEDGKSFTIIDSMVVNEDYYDCSTGSGHLTTVLDTLRRSKNPVEGQAVVLQIEGGSGTPNEGKVYKNEIWSGTGEAVSGHTFTDPDDGGCDKDNLLVHGGKRVGDLMAGNAYIHTKFANVSEASSDAYYENNPSNPKYRAEVQTPDGVLRLELTQIVQNVTEHKGEFPGAYIGIYTDLIEEDSDEITRYTGTKGSGDDGWGMEQIFALGNTTNNIPPRPTFAGTSKVLIGSQQYSGATLTRDVYDTYDAVPAFLTAKGNTQVGYDRPQSPNPNNPICYCSIRKLDNPNLKEGTEPVEYSRYTRDGVDADNREYIYHIYDEEVPNSVLVNFANNNQMLNQTSGGVGNQQVSGDGATGRAQADFLPKDYDKKPSNGSGVNAGTSNGHGTDNPTGVSAEHPYEYYSFRDITVDPTTGTKTYGLFCKPMVGSHFGENGRDGDGIEYVYFALTEAQHLAVKLRYGMGENDKYIPQHNNGVEEIIDINGLTYLQDEYLPELQIMGCDGIVGMSPYDILEYDDNPGPSKERPYIYYSTRKEVEGSGANVEFSEIKEWKSNDYKAEIRVARTQVAVQCDANGSILNDSPITIAYDLKYDRDDNGYVKYGDILVHNQTLSNTITLNNTTYTYDGALSSKDMRIVELQTGVDSGFYRLLYKWRNGSTVVYTTDLYPSSSDYAFNASGTATRISSTYNLNNLGATLNSSPNYTSGQLTIRPSILLGNKDSETITLIGNFGDMYEKYDYVNIEVFKQKAGQPGSSGSAYILDTNYKIINLDNIPSNFKARVENNGAIDSGGLFTTSFSANGDSYTGYSNISNNEGLVNINSFMSTEDLDEFDSLTITASKDGIVLTTTIPTVHNGANGVPYMYRGEGNSSTTYYHSDQRIDIVKYNGTYYMCSTTGHNQSNKVPSANSQYGKTFQGNYESIATGVLFAEESYIENLKVHSTQIDGELKVAEVEASDLGHGKITINRGGAHGNGDSQILLWAHGANNPGITISGETLNTLSTPVSSQVSVGNVSQNQYSTGKYPLIGSNYQNQVDVETFIRNNYNNIVKTGYFSTGNITNNTYESVQIQLTNCTGNGTFKDSNGMDGTYDDGYGLGLYVSSLDAGLCSGSGNNVNVIEYLGPISSGIYRDDAGSTYAIMGSVTFNNSSVKATSFTNSGSNLFIAILPGVDNNLYDPDTGPGGNIANSELGIDFAGTVTLNLKTAGSGQIINPGITMAPNGIRIGFDNNNYFEFLKLGNSNTASSTMVVGGTTKFQY